MSGILTGRDENIQLMADIPDDDEEVNKADLKNIILKLVIPNLDIVFLIAVRKQTLFANREKRLHLI